MSDDIRSEARTWMEIGPDDPGYVETDREVVTLVARLLAALETAEAERDSLASKVQWAIEYGADEYGYCEGWADGWRGAFHRIDEFLAKHPENSVVAVLERFQAERDQAHNTIREVTAERDQLRKTVDEVRAIREEDPPLIAHLIQQLDLDGAS